MDNAAANALFAATGSDTEIAVSPWFRIRTATVSLVHESGVMASTAKSGTASTRRKTVPLNWTVVSGWAGSFEVKERDSVKGPLRSLVMNSIGSVACVPGITSSKSTRGRTQLHDP